MQLYSCILYCGGSGMDTFVELMITVGRFLVGLWPLMFLALLLGVFKRRKGFGAMLRTSVSALTAAWGFFALLHLVFYFFRMDTFRLLPEDINMKAFFSVGLLLAPFMLAIVLEERHKKVKADTLEEMKALSASQFEELVADTYRAQGHKVEVIGSPGDHGIDLVVHTRKGETWLVQCKKYRGKVGEPVIRDFYGVLQASSADAGAVITTGYITAAARLWAEGKPIFLYDGEEFIKVIQTTRIRKSLNLQKRKNAKGFSAPPVVDPVAADPDLDLEHDAPDLPMPGTAYAAVNAGLASESLPVMPVIKETVLPPEPEKIFIPPAPKAQPAPVPSYAACAQVETEVYVMQDKRPFMNMVFETQSQTETLEKEFSADLDLEEDYLHDLRDDLPQEPAPERDNRPFMNMDAAPVCPSCGIPMILRTQKRWFLKPKRQYICQNAPSCDETIKAD